MLVTIIRKVEVKGHYNYKVQDTNGNTHIVKDLIDNLEINKQYNIEIEPKQEQKKNQSIIDKCNDRIRELNEIIYYSDALSSCREYRKEIEYLQTKIKAINICNNKDEYIKYMAYHGYNVVKPIAR